MVKVDIKSVGYGHDKPALKADITLDLRDLFRDPYVLPNLRGLTGEDVAVITNVAGMPGFWEYLAATFEMVSVLVEKLGRSHVTIVVGCVGGRHRSVVFANLLAGLIASTGWIVEVEHRDIREEVLSR